MKNQVEIPINIVVGVIPSSREANAKLETTAAHLRSLFNLIKLSRFGLEESGAENLQSYLDDIANVSEIGSALAASISDSAKTLNVSDEIQ